MEHNGTLNDDDMYEYYEYYYEYDLDYWEDFYLKWLDKQRKLLRTFSTVCYSLFFCISLSGNSFLLWTLLKYKDLRRTSNLLLLHLTVSDLIFTVPLPIWAANASRSWEMGEVGCRFLNGAWSLGLYSYMMFLTAMTVHRYHAVIHAVTTSVFKPHVHTVCIVLWLLCLLCSAPELVIRKMSGNDETYDHNINYTENQYCTQSYVSDNINVLQNYTQILIFFILPFGVIVFCYLRMCLRIRKCRMARKNRTLRLIFLNVVGFFICWAPYNIFLFLLLLSYHGLIPHHLFMKTIAFQAHYTISNSLISLHCGLSPLVHIFGAQKSREHLSLPSSFRCFWVRESTQPVAPQVVETADTALTSGQRHD